MDGIVSDLSYFFLLLFHILSAMNEKSASGGWHHGRRSRLGKKPRRRKSSKPVHPRVAQQRKASSRAQTCLSFKRVPESQKKRNSFIHKVLHQFAQMQRIWWTECGQAV